MRRGKQEEKEEEEENNVTPLRDSQRFLFENSSNPVMQDIGKEPEVKEAEFKQGKIFFGWSLGGSRELEKMIKKSRRITDSENEAKKKALRQFKQKVGRRDVHKGKPVFIDRSSPDVAFIGGERGSGKSFLMRATTNRSAIAGTKHLLVDSENEYYTNNVRDGIQKRLMTLRDDEERQNIRTKVLMPEFIYTGRKQKEMPERGYEYMERFKFGFEIMDANDIDFLLKNKFDDHPDFDNLGSELERELEEEGLESWSQIIGVAERMQESNEFDYHRRAGQIRSYIKNNYKKWDFLGADKKVDLAQIYEGNEDQYEEDEEIPEEDRGYDSVALVLNSGGAVPDKLKMKELYVAFFIKRVRNLIERNKISEPFRISVDEAHNYIPAHTEPQFPPSKKQIRKVIKEDRKRGMSVNMSTQEPNDVQSKNFLSQSKHVFIPQNMRPRPRKKLLRETNIWRSGDRQRNKWNIIFEAMDRYQWLHINVDKGSWRILEIASPLANHRTSG